MDSKAFFYAVAELREAQKEYNENKTAEAKTKAENLEALIDREIYRVNMVMQMREKMPNLDLRLIKEK